MTSKVPIYQTYNQKMETIVRIYGKQSSMTVKMTQEQLDAYNTLLAEMKDKLDEMDVFEILQEVTRIQEQLKKSKP